MAIWSFEQTGSDDFAVWYQKRGDDPVKCGEGPSALALDVFSWVIETAAPFDIVRRCGFDDCVRVTPPYRVAGRILLS